MADAFQVALSTLAEVGATGSVFEILQQASDASVDLLSADSVGVLLADVSGDLRYATSTDPTAAEIERLQITLGEGPCIDAYALASVLAIPDLCDASDRYARFAPAAAATGIRAMLTLPLRHESGAIGALNLMWRTPGQRSDAEQATGRLFADLATAYVVNRRAVDRSTTLAAQLQEALETRVLIEQAKGRIGERLGIGPEAAFELLRRHVRSRNLNLHEFAEEVAAGRAMVSPPD